MGVLLGCFFLSELWIFSCFLLQENCMNIGSTWSKRDADALKPGWTSMPDEWMKFPVFCWGILWKRYKANSQNSLPKRRYPLNCLLVGEAFGVYMFAVNGFAWCLATWWLTFVRAGCVITWCDAIQPANHLLLRKLAFPLKKIVIGRLLSDWNSPF